jgi:arabinose-5-phosphate isomerase
MTELDKAAVIGFGRAVVETEAQAVNALLDAVDDDFVEACRLCLDCRGRIVVTGMGKSGHISGKIAATLASTGSPAFFVHPGEASHGDLGMITEDDVVLAVSNSGETPEIILILRLIKRLGVPLITLTGKRSSTLAREADVNLDVGVTKEACPLNLAPTASTTATLAMGDALAVALLELRGFTEEDFAMSHPGGSLGRRLLLRVSDIMRTGDRVPRVSPGTSLLEGLLEMTRTGLGMMVIVDDSDQILGIFTDGDLRRSIDSGADLQAIMIDDVMTVGGKTVHPDALVAESVRLMEEYAITALPVANEHGQLVGAFNVHDLLHAGAM